LGVLAAPRIAQVLGDEIAKAQSFIELSYRNETAIRVTRDPWKSTLREALKES
jgi:hypothetical protein